MRRAPFISAISVLALVLTACGGGADGTAGAGDTTTPTGTGTGTADGEVATGVGVTDSEIRVAVLNDFSGPIATIGTPAAVGAEVYFDALNADGGVCGREIVAVREDTKYDTKVAIQRYRAVRDDVAFITQLLGTSTVFALANDVQRDNLTTLAGTLAASVIPLEDMWVYQTPFPIEALNGMQWASENADPGDDDVVDVGVVYQNDTYGEEGLAAVEMAADDLDNLEVAGTTSYSPTDEDFTAQVQDMIDSEADVVWLHATPKQTAGILGIAAQQGFEPLFMGNSAGYASSLAEPLGELLDNYRVVNSNATYGEEGIPEMERLVAAVEEYAPDQGPDAWLVTGWISGMVTQAALERACELGDLTREGIAEAMIGLEVDLKGMGSNITYGETLKQQVPAREARVNAIDLESTFPVPVSDWIMSDTAASYAPPEG